MPTIVALNPSGKRGKKKTKAKRKKRRNLTPKQIKYFGTKRQKAALKAKKKKPARKKTAARKTASTSKGTKPMAKKRRKYSKKRTRRRNPNGGGGRNILGVNMFGAVKSGVPLLFGALCAKFAAKKFASGGGEMDNWTWKNYLLGLTGGLIAAFGTGAILRKRAAAQKVFEGALLLVGYKLFTNDIATQNQTLESWFGADDDFDPYGDLSDGMGDIWQSGSSNYVRGVDGYWRPSDERHRLPGGFSPMKGMPQKQQFGDVLVDPDSRYGDVMVTPDARYGETPSARRMSMAIEADGM